MNEKRSAFPPPLLRLECNPGTAAPGVQCLTSLFNSQQSCVLGQFQDRYTAGKISIKLWNVQKAHLSKSLSYSNFHRDIKKLVLILIHPRQTCVVSLMGFFVFTQNHPIEYMEMLQDLISYLTLLLNLNNAKIVDICNFYNGFHFFWQRRLEGAIIFQ